jgi:nitrogen fixation NifU-like protein
MIYIYNSKFYYYNHFIGGALMLDLIYKQTVMDHYKNPRNQGKLEMDSVIKMAYKNPTCGDVVVLYLDITAEKTIRDIKFESVGCSISISSCSMMTELVKGKTCAIGNHLLSQFTRMIQFGTTPENEELQDAEALSGVHKLRARHNCALMGWKALEKAIQIYEQQH